MTPTIEALKYILSMLLAETVKYIRFVRQSLSNRNIKQWETFFRNSL